MKAKKYLGQHFLTSQTTAQKIVNGLDTIDNQDVLEVGPGMGILTQYLLNSAKTFRAVEIDNDASNYLKNKWQNIEIIQADFLKINLNDYYNDSFRLIGNFPYNISSQIVFKIIENSHLIKQWVGMFQLEMGTRLVAQPKNKKDYGILSVLIAFYYDVEQMMTLPPNAFDPPPRVSSIVVKARKKEHIFKADAKLIKRVVKTAFGQRRKTLRNSLASIIAKDLLIKHQFATLRPENLTYLQFEELCVFIESHVSN